jgi:hypothetical protein
MDPEKTDRSLIEDRFIGHFLKHKRNFVPHYEDNTLSVLFNFVHPGELELHKLKGRQKRLVDRRSGRGT